MAKKRSTNHNGRDRLDEAMAALSHSQTALTQAQAILTQNQAAFLARCTDTDRTIAELRRQTDERFARIEKDMAAILRVLAEHSRLLERLPEAVRERIGFNPPPEPGA